MLQQSQNMSHSVAASVLLPLLSADGAAADTVWLVKLASTPESVG